MILIKTMKKKHLASTLKEGRFCFNVPVVFNNGVSLAAAQQDVHDSHFPLNVLHPMIAPIVYEDENGPHYGEIIELADKATMHLQTFLSAHTPLCSFRLVKEQEFVYKYGVAFFRLGNLVDRIKTDFQHDTYIIVFDAETLIDRIAQNFRLCARDVHYGPIDEKFKEYTGKVGYDQAAMFIKDEAFEWQQEFRIIIKPNELQDKLFVQVGSIEDIAYGGDLEQLRYGFMFCNDMKQRDEVNRMLESREITFESIFEI